MRGNFLKTGFFSLVAVAAFCSLFADPAAACDKGKLQRLLSGTFLSAQAKTSAANVASAVANTSTEKSAPKMHGLWNVTDTYQGQVVDMYFDSWHADGNELFIDATPPALDNVCQGIWKQVGHRTFKLKHVSWTFDQNGNVTGTMIFHDVVHLARDGNSFTGSENVFLYDLTGDLTNSFLGDVLQATRITVDF
jgi:hypothetical protein